MTHSWSKGKGGRSSPTKGQNLFHGETSVVSQDAPCFSTLFCDPKDLDHLRLQAPISITAHQCQGQQLKAIEKKAQGERVRRVLVALLYWSPTHLLALELMV